MPPKIELLWPTRADTQLRTQIHRVVHDVAEAGGAIGYPSPPSAAETDAWLEGLLLTVRSGNAAFVVALADHRAEAIGLWRRRPDTAFAHSADIEKVMAPPDARGLGLGRLVVSSLIESAGNAADPSPADQAHHPVEATSK
ncbi:hypothetical protein [Amycolatopsis albispora]|uniref:N-acetyltransferase domain-containing protein n=1 Tax=Amycolatopsis albispora TaxID=1804986 RepID=A0A344L5D4_9PSEU|nr:hypothetical protein [Amycolatopsis albispora]AXB43258.1 hypothetical protein A4R43_12425 [Amycolatopsis albispora]